MWWWLWALGTAVAGDSVAVRCDAIWLQPSKKCPLEASLAATGTGKEQTKAKEAAQSRLTELVAAAAQLQELQYPARPMNPKVCGQEAIKRGRLSCAPAQELTDRKTCYVSFDASDCMAVDPFELTGPAWKMMEKGRERMCETVARAHKTSAPVIQTNCMVRCLEDVLVRCP